MNRDVPDILKRILARKAEEVAERRRNTPIERLMQSAGSMARPRGFTTQLARRIATGDSAVIAEIKRASPSQGVIREQFDPPRIAESYERAGAACLSVLTDRDFFQGSEAALRQAREATALPVLRKDFMVDAYQIYESRVIGADCVLLIAAALDDGQLRDLYQTARGIDLDVLVEVHNEHELERANALNGDLLGINNRDLHTFATSLDTTWRLLPGVPPNTLLVTESGIHSREHVQTMREHGVHAFLVGEAFMRAPDPGVALQALFG